jgi:predicted RNA binding protein YcfA (HicA-like mRNA interferase family)
MKLPRGVSGDRRICAIESLGYKIVREKGSHARLRHEGPPRHSVTIARHKVLKTGTLHSILSDVAQMRSVTIDSTAKLL